MSKLNGVKFLPYQLKRCTNRNVAAKSSIYGEPSVWLKSSEQLQTSYRGITFDFFIDWSKEEFSKEIWVKLLVNSESIQLLFSSSEEEIKEWIRGIQPLIDICKFVNKNNLSAKFLFIDPENDYDDEMEVITFHFCSLCHVRVEKLKINQIKNSIQHWSGGPVGIGRKGLYFADSLLECSLSSTSSLWPGDADLLLVSKNEYTASLLIELKKHNKDTPLSEQRLENYYPNPDARKYNRLGILANYFDVPFLNVYWSTNYQETKVKLELLKFSNGEVSAINNKLIDVPKSESEYNDFYSEVMGFVQKESNDENSI
ncbi:MAG: hypothetical protein VX100_18765 [Pseudomonadota bacterium]|nr:hypothetical protein [Pseudomonadota bacterium]